MLATATGAAAQQTEYRLDGGGAWVVAAAPEPGTDEATIAEARRLLAEGRPERARRVLSAWIREHRFSDSPLLPEAYILRGDARTAAGDEYKALYDYERVIKEFQGSPAFVKALERELDIAVRYINGMRRRFLGMRIYGARGEGEELLVRVQERMPFSTVAERAGLELIRYYYKKRDLKMAAIMCEVFMKNYPRSAHRAMVLRYRIQSNIGLFAGPEYDGSYLIEARELIRQFIEEFPAEAERTGLGDAMLARLDESAAGQMLSHGKWYLRRGDAASARYTLRQLVRDHGLTVAASRGYRMLAEHGWLAGVESPASQAAGLEPAGDSGLAGAAPGPGAEEAR